MVGAFFGLLALVGVLLHRDYGVPWDEQIDRLNGIINAKYVALHLAPELAKREENFATIPDMSQNEDLDHGVFFQLPLVLLERVAGVNDTREIYFMRHLVTFFTFVAGAYVFYRLATWRFASWKLGLLGAAALVASPRFFAEAFYNYKDLVFLSFFTLAIYTLLLLLRRPTWQRALLHAAATAAAVDVRSMGIILPALTLGFLFLEASFRPLRRRGFALAALLYLPLSALFIVLGWPYLWENPLSHFAAAFLHFSRYTYESSTLYLGQQISILHLPWHYVPVWLLVTTPVLYSALAGIGIRALLRDALKAPLKWLSTTEGRHDALFMAWLLGPVLAIIVLQSVLYDGWRHLYFVYPAWLLLALRGVQAAQAGWQRATASTRRLLRVPAGMLLILGLLHPLYRMVRDHPYQNMYFSFLPGTVAHQLFERDYWGLSGWQGMAWILRQDASPHITVGTDLRTRTIVLLNSRLLLPPAERARVEVVPSPKQAKYFMTVYRWHPAPYPPSYGREIYQIQVNGNKILSVFRRPD
ncbi:hypothetical protein GCM10011383_11390 [Hymenobacter cavernae]|uniref:Glycosyltransferase RgtA/B/C/D-like domain-containing protein n=1 Tax=Hymenobacter cavernae TaxID=2044852 RepID=A0ABQ1TS97_9BACT|nr:hypothetical protein GCM10011383_11390 [Hymenobacter cavernae]